MARRKQGPNYVARAQARASLRGWWGFTCGIVTITGGSVAWTYLMVALANWHDRLHHPELIGVFPRHSELWQIAPFITVAPCFTGAGLVLNTIIWLIPPLRALSEGPARINPDLGFWPMQRGLAKLTLWSIWTLPLAVAAAWLAP